MTGPPPVYFGSSPYWKDAVVGSPLGLTEPVNAAVVPPIDGGAPVDTGEGSVPAVAAPWTTALDPPLSAIVMVVV